MLRMKYIIQERDSSIISSTTLARPEESSTINATSTANIVHQTFSTRITKMFRGMRWKVRLAEICLMH